MLTDNEQLDRLLEGLRAGDSAAEHEFWRLYGKSLERVAESRLSSQLQIRVGPEDVALSACRTFLRRARLGEFRVPDSAALWRLLSVITLTKAREQARFHRRQKRSIDQEIRLDRPTADSGEFDIPAPQAEDIADQFAELLSAFSGDERAVVEFKLQDLTNDEIALRLDSSERTVRRLLKRVAAKLGGATGRD
jgi:RNA polymerase sigma-70 factor, ECF subfamily